MRKAQISIQFNWVFVLVAGGILFLFFFTVINQQQKNAAQVQTVQVMEHLDTIITAISTEKNSVQTYTLPRITMDFWCEEGYHAYTIGDAMPVDITYETYFTQKNLRADDLVTWTQEWLVPFPAATLTMLANKRTIFVFVTSGNQVQDSLIESLYNKLEDEFVKDLVVDTGLDISTYAGYDRAVFIAVQGTNIILDNQKNAVARIVSGQIEGTGTVKFISPSGNQATHAYLREPLLWGAIFSEDADYYNCTLGKALNRLIMSARVLEDRSQRLATAYTYTSCESFMIHTKNAMNTTIIHAQRGDLQGIHTKTRYLEQLASDSLRGYNCPYLY